MAIDSPFERALIELERAYEEDPERASASYHHALARWVERLEPTASEALRLAARCQHLHRHRVPRASFPEGASGYKQWRSGLARMHADEASKVAREAGFDEELAARVADLVQKKRLRSDPETQLLEDAVCLTFLELELERFAAKHDDDKLVSILQKTWAKMTPRGHAAALELARSLPPSVQVLLQRAVGA